MGSQTIFVLDENHCLILTNLEYAQNPDQVDLSARRTNPRYRGNTLVRTDAYIRTRKLSSEEVIAVNYLLKSRARKYMASSNKDWLYPEKNFFGDWSLIAKVLLPKDELYRFGGEIFVSYEDGTVHYQDAFGRTSGAHKYLQKKHKKKLGGNDGCGCGSGKKFKNCCQGKPVNERPSWDIYGIRERNLMLIRAAEDILGLNKGKTWDDVRRNLSNEQVANIHDFYGGLWPRDTNIESLLPRPDPNISRGVFLGTADPRTVGANGIGMLNYFDEIILPNPFINPRFIKPNYDPTHSPSQHKEQTLKNLLFLFSIEPQINAGIIHLVPDPTDFNQDFRNGVWAMADERTKGWSPSEEDMAQFKLLSDDDLKRSISRMSKPALKAYIKRIAPETLNGMLEQVVEHMKQQSEDDPLALLQELEPSKDNAQLRIIKAFNLETTLFLAGLTGAFIYTDMMLHWRHLHEHTMAGNPSKSTALWKPVTDAIKSIMFPIQHDALKQMEDRYSGGTTGSMRKIISRLFGAMESNNNPTTSIPMVAALNEQVKNLVKKQAANWAFEAKLEISVPLAGFENNAIRRLIFTYGRSSDVRIAPLAMYVQFYRVD